MQAKVGAMGGYFGFDYNCLPVVFRSYDILEAEWFIYLEKFQVITRVAMKYFNEHKESK